MLKLVFTGVWICAVSLGSVYFSIQHASAPVETDAEQQRRASQEYVSGELITVPVITDGAVQGYFLTKLSFSVDKAKARTMDVPLKQSVTNALYDILVGQKLINVADTSNFDLANFKTAVKDGLNKQLRGEVIFEVLVEQLEYLSKADVARIANAANEKQRQPVPIVDKNGQTAHDQLPESEKRAAAAGQ
jgi:flagellar basal body-associated protein FliL